MKLLEVVKVKLLLSRCWLMVNCTVHHFSKPGCSSWHVEALSPSSICVKNITSQSFPVISPPCQSSSTCCFQAWPIVKLSLRLGIQTADRSRILPAMFVEIFLLSPLLISNIIFEQISSHQFKTIANEGCQSLMQFTATWCFKRSN